MRVLIIEDNKELNESMSEALLAEGIYIDSALTGIEGEEKAYCNDYDAILLDLNLPDKDGMDILKDMRKEQVQTPVLIITAREDLNERIAGLQLGADDFIIKPFSLKELHARILAVVRRYHGHSTNRIEKEAFLLDCDQRIAYYQKQEIPLAAKEFDIFTYLMLRSPALVSSEEIAEHVYDENFNPFSSVLRVHLARLRKKLLDACGYDVLKTMRGKGYYLCLEKK